MFKRLFCKHEGKLIHVKDYYGDRINELPRFTRSEWICPKCGKPIKPQTIDEIVNSILKLETGTKIQILAPIVKGKKGEYQSLFEELRQEGFVRVKVDGEIYNLDEDEIKLAKTKSHTIFVVIDRVVVKPEAKSRIADSVQIALKNSFVHLHFY